MSVLSKIKNTYKGLEQGAKSIATKTNKSKGVLMADMCYCLLKYAASPNNYEKFEFYNLTGAQRATYVTYGISQKMIKKFNNQADIDVLENKLKFAEVFSDVFNRGYLSVTDMTYEDFNKFCEGKEKFICKPYEGSQGADIKVYHIENNIEEIYKEIKENFATGFMLEEWIPQHPVLAKIYPDAVNCLRIITVFDGKETHLITGGVTFGVNSEIANGSQISIVAPLDFDTGVLHKPAATFSSELYDKHPKTNETILGVKLPFWEEIKEMLATACARIPTIGYVGWDIAITRTGPVIIDGNTTPGYKYYQIPRHLEDGIGNREKYEKYL